MGEFRIETNAYGKQRVVTIGLAALGGQQECAVALTEDLSQAEAEHVLNFIADYITRLHQTIHAGDTMRYGWSTLRFVAEPGSGVLVLEELEMPLDDRNDCYIPGAARAVSLVRYQDETTQRLGSPVVAHHPHRSERVVICCRLAPASTWPVLVMDRLDRDPGADYSGWFAGCGDPSHSHDDLAELSAAHLVHLVQHEPRLLPYLALPEGTRLVFEASRVIIFPPNQDEGIEDMPLILS